MTLFLYNKKAMKNILSREIFHLKVSEWLIFSSIIIIYTLLTSWVIVANPFQLPEGETNTNFASISMSWIAATFTILGTFFLARGKRIGFILDAIAFIALALNLVWLANDPMLPLGIFYFLVPVPVTFLAFYLWKKRSKSGTEEKETSKKLKTYSFLFIGVGTAITYISIFFAVGYDNLITHGLGNVWELPRMFFEIFKIFLMSIATLFFVLGIKEAWTVVMVLEATNIVLYSISFACSPNPDPGYFLNIILYTFEFCIASYGAALWYFKKLRNN